MIKNIIFDFGNVLVEWNMHYLFDKVINNPQKCEFFLNNVCNSEWNTQMDAGKPFKQGIAERIALYPEWEKEIKLYFSQWQESIHGPIPGMYTLAKELKEKGYNLYGLSNWSSETFPMTRKLYPVFDLLTGYILSGDVKMVKPDPKIYQLLLHEYNLNPEESIFIDDNTKNIITARQLGIHAILFKNCYQLRKELDKIL